MLGKVGKVVPLTPIPELAGVKNLMTLLAFLEDTSAVSRELERFEVARKSANEVIAQVGKASEIEALWAKAGAAKTDAEDLLRDAAERLGQAKAQAKGIVDAAKAGVVNRANELESGERALSANQLILREAVAAHEEAADAREGVAEARDEKQTMRAEELLKQEADLAAREDTLADTTKRMKAAMV